MKVIESKQDKGTVIYKCVGCGKYHIINTNENDLPAWGFNGDFDNPTLSPSILMRMPIKDNLLICHHFVNNGFIEFCSDSTHELAGQKVEMPHIDTEGKFYKQWLLGSW